MALVRHPWQVPGERRFRRYSQAPKGPKYLPSAPQGISGRGGRVFRCYVSWTWRSCKREGVSLLAPFRKGRIAGPPRKNEVLSTHNAPVRARTKLWYRISTRGNLEFPRMMCTSLHRHPSSHSKIKAAEIILLPQARKSPTLADNWCLCNCIEKKSCGPPIAPVRGDYHFESFRAEFHIRPVNIDIGSPVGML